MWLLVPSGRMMASLSPSARIPACGGRTPSQVLSPKRLRRGWRSASATFSIRESVTTTSKLWQLDRETRFLKTRSVKSSEVRKRTNVTWLRKLRVRQLNDLAHREN